MKMPLYKPYQYKKQLSLCSVYAVLCCVIAMLSGCYNIRYPTCLSLYNSEYSYVAPYVQERRIYDQWASVLSVVVLWCTPEVVRIHNQIYKERVGYEYPYKHPHALILMMPYQRSPQLYTSYKSGVWAVTLRQDNRIIPVYHIYQTTLSPEYQYLLAPHYNRFYEVYAVIFEEDPQLPFTIALQSPEYTVDLVWKHQ